MIWSVWSFVSFPETRLAGLFHWGPFWYILSYNYGGIMVNKWDWPLESSGTQSKQGHPKVSLLCPDLFHMIAKPNTHLYFYIDISVEEHPASFQLWGSFNSNSRRGEEKKTSLIHSIQRLLLLARFWKLSCIVWVPPTPPASQTRLFFSKTAGFSLTYLGNEVPRKASL